MSTLSPEPNSDHCLRTCRSNSKLSRLQGATDVENGSLVLRVDRVGLEGLVRQLASTDPAAFDLEPSPSRVAMRPITRLNLRPGEGDSLLIAINAEVATITGSHDNFKALAGELKHFDQENDLDEPGMHVHFDPSGQQLRGLKMSSDSIADRDRADPGRVMLSRCDASSSEMFYP